MGHQYIISGMCGGAILLASLTAAAEDLDFLNLPKGFEAEIWADVPDARSMTLSKDGKTLYVGTRGSRIYKVAITPETYRAAKVSVFASGLKVANGIDLDDQGHLVVAEQHRIIRISETGNIEELVPPGLLPDRSHHGWRYAAFGPDGAYYVAVGAPCNICEVSGVEGTILRFDPNDWSHTVYARGVRNSVGFDWHPDTAKMYFTDNGGDNLGDDIPPDELNIVEVPGQHFGYPYQYGKGAAYPQYRDAEAPKTMISTFVDFQAHVAALGIEFYEGKQFPKSYDHAAIIAQHGSWNRSEPVGYRIMMVQGFDRPSGGEKSVFIDGWLGENGEVRGRPVDLEELPDGSLLISDDYRDLIYRIRYNGPRD